MARKILLADDSVTAQNMGRKILADAGYDVIAVNNGSAALKKIAELKPDLAILDVYMPGYSGLEVCQRLKESPDSARIPVLLSVGKLEPFKPEEAQRVRAEGYIVKPFEASELLSALAKLEDKIVPRAEASKPGRFARAIAAAEESSNGKRSAAANPAGGWDKRIGFPQEKTEPEPNVSDDASIYNPMNRDLRTVVETPAEKLAEAEKDQKRQGTAREAETNVDVAALAPAGLPKDVTPEEIAAIAAAAAQIQMAAAIVGEQRESNPGIYEPVNPATPNPLHDEKTQVRFEETSGDPVTMAATAESVVALNSGGPRWAAVPVALEDEEASVSLDQEMQRAYRAFRAEEPLSASAMAEAPPQETCPENSSALAEAATETPVDSIRVSEPAPVVESEPAVNAETTHATSGSAEMSETTALVDSSGLADFVASEPATVTEVANASVIQSETAGPEPSIREVASADAAREAPPAAARESHELSEVAEAADSVSESAQPAMAEWHPVAGAEPAVTDAATVSNSSFTPILRNGEQTGFDPEAVKSTAAAWASWRQIRDNSTDKTTDMVADQPSPEATVKQPQALPNNAALAAAAGAEQNLQESSSAQPIAAVPPNGHSTNAATDVASIVDSVLADLRPKLMEEISRKMAEKK